MNEATDFLKKTYRKIKHLYWKSIGHSPSVNVDIKIDTYKVGSEYGGWVLAKNLINPNSVVYSFGVGYDITFDEAVIEKYKCSVYAFDPTQKVIDWLVQQTLPTGFFYSQTALSDKDERLIFYTIPESLHFNFDKNIHTHSHNSDKASLIPVEVAGARLQTLMKDRGHHQIDLLKLDIEGSEYSAVDDMIACGIKPVQLLIEFHHYGQGRNGVARTVESIQKIRKFGYYLFAISVMGTEYSFIRKDTL